jgi:ADP-ribose pyrophosphatase YjhB (NUDIX family)
MEKGIDYTGIAVTCMCHDGNGRYLIEQRSDKCRDEHFTWSPVGSGGVGQGEMIEDTVRREVLEECGAEATEIEHMGFREAVREHEGKTTHWVFFDYKVKIDPSKVSITEPEKCLEQRWCTIDEIPEPMHSQFPSFLEQYKDKL